jgi:HEAT repeat protein
MIRLLKRRLLLRALSRGDDAARWSAARQLSGPLGRGMREQFERTLVEAEDPTGRAAAAYVLGFLGDAGAADALAARLVDVREEPEVRAYAAEALGHLLQLAPVLANVRTAVSRGLRDPTPEVRFWCAFAAANLELRETRPLLEHLAETDRARIDGWWSVAEEAQWALRVLSGEHDAPLPPYE